MEKFEHIIIVDDDIISNIANEKIVRESGLCENVKVTLNGGHAVCFLTQKFEENLYGAKILILLDLEMPIMDGFEFLQFYDRCNFLNKENVQVIVMADSPTFDKIERFRSLGAIGYVNKPLSYESLKNVFIQRNDKIEDEELVEVSKEVKPMTYRKRANLK